MQGADSREGGYSQTSMIPELVSNEELGDNQNE